MRALSVLCYVDALPPAAPVQKSMDDIGCDFTLLHVKLVV
jgi:hypothetical protein